MRLRRTTIIGALLLTAVLAGCDQDGSVASLPGNTIVMREYEFSPKQASVESGQTLTVRNQGSIAHNLVIEKGDDPLDKPDKLIGTDTFLGGRSERLKVDLKPGRYLMICTVPGHRQLGMYGTLQVR